MQRPVQQSEGWPHIWPSGKQPGGPQTPLLHWALQQSPAPTHEAPFGLQLEHFPFVQIELQQSVAFAQLAPPGWHGAQGWLQIEPTSLTQSWSQLCVQQKASAWQICEAQTSHAASSFDPCVQRSCAHAGGGTHWPFAHALLQQSAPVAQENPFGAHAFEQTPFSQSWLQQSAPLAHALPRGAHF